MELKQLKIDGGLEIPLIDIENNIKFIDEQIIEKGRGIFIIPSGEGGTYPGVCKN